MPPKRQRASKAAEGECERTRAVEEAELTAREQRARLETALLKVKEEEAIASLAEAQARTRKAQAQIERYDIWVDMLRTWQEQDHVDTLERKKELDECYDSTLDEERRTELKRRWAEDYDRMEKKRDNLRKYLSSCEGP